MNYYMEALKEYNAKSGKKWCIPKKGTAEYNEVMRIKTQMEKQSKKKKEELESKKAKSIEKK